MKVWTHQVPVWRLYAHGRIHLFRVRDEAVKKFLEWGGFITCDYGHGEQLVVGSQ